MFRKLKARLPKDKTEKELEEHCRAHEDEGLEKGDGMAIFIAVMLNLVLPLLGMLTVFYGLIWLLFLR